MAGAAEAVVAPAVEDQRGSGCAATGSHGGDDDDVVAAGPREPVGEAALLAGQQVHHERPPALAEAQQEFLTKSHLGKLVLVPTLDGTGTVKIARIAACLADRRPGEFFVVDANGGLLTETAPA